MIDVSSRYSVVETEPPEAPCTSESEVAQCRRRIAELETAIGEALGFIGLCPVAQRACEGCAYENGEAEDLLRGALGLPALTVDRIRES